MYSYSGGNTLGNLMFLVLAFIVLPIVVKVYKTYTKDKE